MTDEDHTEKEAGEGVSNASAPTPSKEPGAPVFGAPPPQQKQPVVAPQPTQPNDSRMPPEPIVLAPKTGGTELKDDISKILAESKLPERRFAPEKKPTQKAPVPPSIPGSQPEIHEQTLEEKLRPATEKSSVVPMHTLKDDLQGVVKDQNLSLVRAAALEQQKKSTKLPENMPVPRVHKTRGILFASILLVLLGIAALGGVYLVMVQQLGTPTPEQSNSLIFTEQSAVFELQNEPANATKVRLAQARTASTGALGSITRITPALAVAQGAEPGREALRPATLREFLGAMGAGASEDLLRALSNEFFFGIHTVDKNAPVLIVEVSLYDRAFAGMLEWEETMNGDLAPLFTTVPPLMMSPEGLLVTRSFTDRVMRNYDTRVLLDDGAQIQLYYSFLNRNLLVIAESPHTLTEVLSRLRAERRL